MYIKWVSEREEHFSVWLICKMAADNKNLSVDKEVHQLLSIKEGDIFEFCITFNFA